MKKTECKMLLISLAISVGTGMLAALLTMEGMEAFDGAAKPPLSPPSWLFPVVWTALYILMGVGAYLIYTSKKRGATGALAVYALQLALNFMWSVLFFGFSAYWAAFACLVLLAGAIIWMIAAFYKLNKKAALLQLPYLAWVLFAGYLNAGVALLN